MINDDLEKIIKADDTVGTANIKVVGVGGGGQNAVNRMYRERVEGVEYISVNTDSQALENSEIPLKLRVGDQTARGLGVGGDPAKGRQCHEEDREEIKSVLEGADLVFIAAGMGGGTGTGGAPVVAEISKELGALTVGVVTKPFNFEGKVRKTKALEGVEALKEQVDTLIVIPNDRLTAVSDANVTIQTAFKMADDVLRQGIQSIAELILCPGEINLDFADVKAVMDGAGAAWMAIGRGSGENRAVEAAEEALQSPLLEVEVTGAKGVIFNVTGGPDVTIHEVQTASEIVASTVHPDANIIYGQTTDHKMENEIKITLIATGFPSANDIEEDEIKNASEILGSDKGMIEIPPFLRNHPSARNRIRKSLQKKEQLGFPEEIVPAD
ncbi:MAG: cell division protein FtsZ [Dehalococcoidia bacterium]|nr:cell division protein FtsZ [Dehalococcoidia bacterium]MQG08950.1 cell division protein FtsZ [SAR202 cluster bacterium]|tara:strand:- start:825 stop:1976 length:1152 start_codon:yes stop_codon:yes gene_type:complete